MRLLNLPSYLTVFVAIAALAMGCGSGDSGTTTGLGMANPQALMAGAMAGQMPAAASPSMTPTGTATVGSAGSPMAPGTAQGNAATPASNASNTTMPVMAPMVCTETCQYAGDGECDDGGPNYWTSACAYGTDCADCGSRIEGPTTPCTEAYSRGQECWMLEDCEAYGLCEGTCVAQCQQQCSNGIKCANLAACVEECDGNEGCEDRCLERYPACWACDRTCERECQSECGADHGQCRNCLDGFQEAEATCESCNRDAFIRCYRNWCNAAIDRLLSCQMANGCDDLSWGTSDQNCTTSNCGQERDAFFGCVERNGEDIERRFETICAPRWDQCTVVVGATRAAMPPGQSEPEVAEPMPPVVDADGNLCEETCYTAGDGECDDGGPSALYSICYYGSDCADCGNRKPATGVCATPTNCHRQCAPNDSACRDACWANASPECRECNWEVYDACYGSYCPTAVQNLGACLERTNCSVFAISSFAENCAAQGCAAEVEALETCQSENADAIQMNFDTVCGPWETLCIDENAVRPTP